MHSIQSQVDLELPQNPVVQRGLGLQAHPGDLGDQGVLYVPFFLVPQEFLLDQGDRQVNRWRLVNPEVQFDQMVVLFYRLDLLVLLLQLQLFHPWVLDALVLLDDLAHLETHVLQVVQPLLVSHLHLVLHLKGHVDQSHHLDLWDLLQDL